MTRELPTLWQQACASTCHAFGECGGSPSAPCGCVFVGTDRAYLCDECWLNCRERIGSESGDIGENHYEDGLALHDLHIANTLLDLPALVPAITRELPRHAVLNAVAAGLGDLFRRDPKSHIRTSPRLVDSVLFKTELRCERSGQVLGVLNGADRALELLWNADLSVVAPQLLVAGLTAITGPTFSVLGERGVTPYHNLTMLRRHHRVAQKLFDVGMEVIPNLYWRTPGGWRQWADVLRRSDIQTVARDFSRTRSGPQFHAHLDGLLDLLKAVKRPMRVIVVGVGIRKAVRTAMRIGQLGCTSTIVTADPVRLGINKGAEVFRDATGHLAIRVRPDMPREDLALRNIATLSRELRRVTKSRRNRRAVAAAQLQV